MLDNNTSDIPSLVVLISGRGSNLHALLDHPSHGLDYQIACVISNRPDAAGLSYANARGIPTRVVDHTGFDDRESFDAALLAHIESFKPALVVLAGFMRVLTDGFVRQLDGRLLNIHPSLLPAFPGLKTHERVIDAGCRIHGATVHFVTPTLDHGPVVSQAVVPVMQTDNPQTLAARVLMLEHPLLTGAVIDFCKQRLRVDGLRVLRTPDATPAVLVHPDLATS